MYTKQDKTKFNSSIRFSVERYVILRGITLTSKHKVVLWVVGIYKLACKAMKYLWVYLNLNVKINYLINC